MNGGPRWPNDDDPTQAGDGRYGNSGWSQPDNPTAYQPPYGQSPQYGQQPYGQTQPIGQQPYGQYPGGPQYGQQQYGQQQFGQFPGTQPPGGPPNGSVSKTAIGITIAAVVVALLLLGGVVTWLIVRDDGPSDAAAASSSSSSAFPSSTADSSTTYSLDPPYTYPSTTSSTRYYGSIAVSRTTGDIGYAINYSSESTAVSAALSKCAAPSCETVVRFWNACGAVAQSQANLYWGWAWDRSRQGAIDRAMSEVRGDQPKLLTAQCTTNAGDSSAGGSLG